MKKIKNRLKILLTFVAFCALQQSNAQVAGAPYIPADKVPFSFLRGSANNEANKSNVLATADGGYIFLGFTNNAVGSGDITEAGKGGTDAWVVKMDATGNIVWQKRYGGSGQEGAGHIIQTADGGYLFAVVSSSSANGDVTGTNHGTNNNDIWIVKLTATGAISWQQLYGGNLDETVGRIRQTTEGGYILVASSASSANGNVAATNKGAATIGSTDTWIVKLTATGAISWQQLYGGTNYETANDVRQTSDGGYIVLSSSNSVISGNITGTKPGGVDAWILKLTNVGAISWQRLYGGTGSEQMGCIIQTADGGYIMSGNSSSSADGNVTATSYGDNDVWVVKMTNTGVISWNRLYGGTLWDLGGMIVQTSDGGYLAISSTQSSGTGLVPVSHGPYDVWVLKLTATGVLSWQKLYGGSANESVYSLDIAPGGYIISAATSSSNSGDVTDSSNGQSDYWIFKIDTAGNIIWVPDTNQ